MSLSESAIQKAQKYELLDPDVRLMLKVRDDNGKAFEELVQKYEARLVSFLGHQVRGQDQAEDLAQEVFMRVFRARKNYVPSAKFSTWLFTITHNVASNCLLYTSPSPRDATLSRMPSSA